LDVGAGAGAGAGASPNNADAAADNLACLSIGLPAGSMIMEIFPYKYWKVGYKPLAEEYGVHHHWVRPPRLVTTHHHHSLIIWCPQLTFITTAPIFFHCVFLQCAIPTHSPPPPCPLPPVRVCPQMQSQGPVSFSHYLLFLFSQKQCMHSHWCRDFSRNEDIIMTPDMLKNFLKLGEKRERGRSASLLVLLA
jgi:hypothetical protein